jgi:cation diffusion facilitator CzcD-associated flavoprotein CzcO
VIAKTAEWYCVRFLEKEVKDPVLREKLRPVGRLGAKRPLVSRDLYKLLQASNVEVISDPITRIDGSGVFCTVKEEISKKGQEMTCSSGIDSEESQESHNKVDVIIWGTGFKMQGWGTAFEILGRRGQSLGQHWGGKPKTLYGKL